MMLKIPSLLFLSSAPVACGIGLRESLFAREPVAINPTVPFEISALSFDTSLEIDGGDYGDCAAPYGVDAQITLTDEQCQQVGPCHIAFTKPDEQLTYSFFTTPEQAVVAGDGTSAVFVDITVRVSSVSETKEVQLEVYDDGQLGPVKSLTAPGMGFEDFHDVTWKRVALRNTQLHELVVGYTDGQINMCSIKIELSMKTVPITWAALDFYKAHDTTEVRIGSCNDDSVKIHSLNAVDAHQVRDPVCVERDGSTCTIAFTEAGESVSYYFNVPETDDYDVWARIASNGGDRQIRMELSPFGKDPNTYVVDAPNRGWNEYRDVAWDLLYLEKGDYTLTIHFDTGGVNLCSVAVRPSSERFLTYVPSQGTSIDAMFYAKFSEQTTDVRNGNCRPEDYIGADYGIDTSIDAQKTSSYICPGPCNIGWTLPGEYVMYEFQTTREHMTMSLLIASANRSKYVRVQLIRGNGLGELETLVSANGDGYQEFDEILVWKDLYVGEPGIHSVYIHFDTGNVNLCGINII